jgi:nitrate/TMAO reductase-like tetraheme cytochrome c subunit
MNGQGPFAGDAENVIRWVTVCGILLAFLGFGLVMYVLARKREFRESRPAKMILLIGIFVLPAVTMLLSSVVGFHKVKQSCTECHAMEPWVSDMTNPESKTLAAKHYQNRWINEDQCYTCHTGYGLAGNVRAKLGGLRHVWHQYVAGVPAEIKISRPFPVATCLHCHAEQKSYNAVDQHIDPEMKPDILSGKMSCFECHESPHPRRKP